MRGIVHESCKRISRYVDAPEARAGQSVFSCDSYLSQDIVDVRLTVLPNVATSSDVQRLADARGQPP